MAMSTEELESLVRGHLPDDFLKRALRSVFAAHKDSTDDANRLYARTEARDVVGYMRRASMEGNLRSVATMYSNMTADTVESPGSNKHHVEVRSGPVVLTESLVSYPCAMVDRSNFRTTLAEANTFTLFDLPTEDEPEEFESGEELFALLLHSKYRGATAEDNAKYGHLPGSAYIVCPSPEVRYYLCEINLFDLFPDVVATHLPNDWRDEAVVRYQYDARKSAWPNWRRTGS